MKTLIGILFCITGVVVGVYVGFYLLFIRGITQLIQGITPVVNATNIAWGIGKILVASPVGVVITMALIGMGSAIAND